MNTVSPIHAGEHDNPLLAAAFNQDQGCFALAHDHGFRVYSTDPMELRVKREFEEGGIGIAQMLHRTNYVALVGGGRNPRFPQNKVVIWDDLRHRHGLSLEFLSPILNVLLSRSRIVVVLKNKVHVYTFASPPQRLAAYDTVDNPNGVAALAGHILAFPKGMGQIQLVNVADADHLNASIVRAHRSSIRCLTLSVDGSMVASTSDMGTIIRIHATINTALLHEYRRGLDRAVTFAMAFSRSGSRLAVLSDKNTLHVFDTVTALSNNRRHLLGRLPLLPAYFSSEWSFVSARVSGDRGVVGWADDDSVIVVWTEPKGRWEKFVIIEQDGEDVKWELVREAWRGFEGL